MEKIDSFNCSENLVEMYVFHIRYCKTFSKYRFLRYRSIESTPFNYRECCNGCMEQTMAELRAKHYKIISYYIKKVMVSDSEQQF